MQWIVYVQMDVYLTFGTDWLSPNTQDYCCHQCRYGLTVSKSGDDVVSAPLAVAAGRLGVADGEGGAAMALLRDRLCGDGPRAGLAASVAEKGLWKGSCAGGGALSVRMCSGIAPVHCCTRQHNPVRHFMHLLLDEQFCAAQGGTLCSERCSGQPTSRFSVLHTALAASGSSVIVQADFTPSALMMTAPAAGPRRRGQRA
jgi:hypothetical protein